MKIACPINYKDCYDRILGVTLECGPIIGATRVSPWRLIIGLWFWGITIDFWE